jgi:alcohol dehydrogenase (NADP+)
MKYYTFKNGDKIPMLGLGTWKAATGEVYGAVTEAIKLGYRHIDCAWMYGNEIEIGLAIKDAISDGIVNREGLWVTSKLWNNSHGKENVIPALKQSLSDLQLDYLDLYLIHWPIALKPEIKMPTKAEHYLSLNDFPIANTWQGFEDAVNLGLTKHIGVSNFSVKKIKDLMAVCEIKPEVNQIELHPYLQQNSMFQFCKKENIHLTAYAPLSSKSTGFVKRGTTIPDLMTDVEIAEIAKELDITHAQVLLAWGINRGTSVIPKSVNPERLKQNLEAADIELGAGVMERITKLDKHYRYVDGRFWTVPGSGYTVENIWDE